MVEKSKQKKHYYKHIRDEKPKKKSREKRKENIITEEGEKQEELKHRNLRYFKVYTPENIDEATSEEVKERFRKLTDMANGLLKSPTRGEEQMKKVLESRKIEFIQQYPIVDTHKHRYIIDFYLPNEKTYIEIDGGYHNKPEQIKRDKKKENILKATGRQLIRYTNDEVRRMYCELLTEEYGKELECG